MMNYIWAALFVLSLFFGIVNNKISEVTGGLLSGGKNAVDLALILLGAICVWGGIMKIAERSGLTHVISRMLRPLTSLIFPGLSSKSESINAISMNMTANLLGLGNAATPFGLLAMAELQKINPLKQRASNYMVTFVVLNTASLQLIPTTVAVIRGNHGAASPFDILPSVWVASIVSLTVALIASRIFCKMDASPSKRKYKGRVAS